MAYSTIHAKAETLTTSSTYCESFERRCLIPFDGFYEWDTIGPKSKEPYAIAVTHGSLFALAGLWDRWKDRATGQTLYTFTVITTDPNELIGKFHHHMPVVLAPDDYERWMAPIDPAHLPVDLLRPYLAENLAVWGVSAAVGNWRNDHPGLIEPI